MERGVGRVVLDESGQVGRSQSKEFRLYLEGHGGASEGY